MLKTLNVWIMFFYKKKKLKCKMNKIKEYSLYYILNMPQLIFFRSGLIKFKSWITHKYCSLSICNNVIQNVFINLIIVYIKDLFILCVEHNPKIVKYKLV